MMWVPIKNHMVSIKWIILVMVCWTCVHGMSVLSGI